MKHLEPCEEGTGMLLCRRKELVVLCCELEWTRASHIGPAFHGTAYFKVIMNILL